MKYLKKRQKYGFLMGLDTPSNLTSSLAKLIAITGGMDVIEQYFKTLESITPQDIQNEAKRMNASQRTTIELMGAK